MAVFDARMTRAVGGGGSGLSHAQYLAVVVWDMCILVAAGTEGEEAAAVRWLRM
jgi:hypothetical protein